MLPRLPDRIRGCARRSGGGLACSPLPPQRSPALTLAPLLPAATSSLCGSWRRRSRGRGSQTSPWCALHAAPAVPAAPAAHAAVRSASCARHLALPCPQHKSRAASTHPALQACGSGGTTAGIALGVHLSGLGLNVHAYGVCDDERCATAPAAASGLLCIACSIIPSPNHNPFLPPLLLSNCSYFYEYCDGLFAGLGATPAVVGTDAAGMFR